MSQFRPSSHDDVVDSTVCFTFFTCCISMLCIAHHSLMSVCTCVYALNVCILMSPLAFVFSCLCFCFARTSALYFLVALAVRECLFGGGGSGAAMPLVMADPISLHDHHTSSNALSASESASTSESTSPSILSTLTSTLSLPESPKLTPTAGAGAGAGARPSTPNIPPMKENEKRQIRTKRTGALDSKQQQQQHHHHHHHHGDNDDDSNAVHDAQLIEVLRNIKNTSSSNTNVLHDENEQATNSDKEAVHAYHQHVLGSISKLDKIELKMAHLMQLIAHEHEKRLVAERQMQQSKAKQTRTEHQKNKLESLCKELQRRNKLINEEIGKVSTEQQRQHQELKEKFEKSLQEISQQLKKHAEERDRQLDENAKLREKLQQLLKYEEVREQHFAHQLRTKELEAKLFEARLGQQTEYAASEARKSKAAKDRIDHLLASEQQLRLQLQSYAEKFEQVQSTLTKSNDLFSTFKNEMERLSVQIKRLEREKSETLKKNQDSQATIISLFEQRTNLMQEVEKLKRHKTKLQSLCLEYEKNRKKEKEARAVNASSTTTNDQPSSSEDFCDMRSNFDDGKMTSAHSRLISKHEKEEAKEQPSATEVAQCTAAAQA